jgi:hypothetical protein
MAEEKIAIAVDEMAGERIAIVVSPEVSSLCGKAA